MSHKKLKHDLKDSLFIAVQEVFANYNSEAGKKLKKSTRNSAKELTSKFVKSLKQVEKAERKAGKKLQKSANKETRQWLKSHEQQEVKISKNPIMTSMSSYDNEPAVNITDTAFGSNQTKQEKDYHIET